MKTSVFVFIRIHSSISISSLVILPSTIELVDSHWLCPPLLALCVAEVRRLLVELGNLFRMNNFWVKNLSQVFICGSYNMGLLQVGFWVCRGGLRT